MKLCMSESYNQHSRSQSSLWELAKEQSLLDDALSGALSAKMKDESKDESRAIVCVAELGCATGGNSLGPLSFFANSIANSLRDSLRSKATKLEILLELLLVDRPENHWEILSQTVTPQAILSHGANSASENSFPISIKSVPKCFYEVCSEEASVDLSYSFSATHWMKAIPNHQQHIENPCFAIFPTCPYNNLCQNSLELWQKAAQIQLCEFATSRAKELKPGGRFLGSFACLESGRDSTPWSRMGKLVRDVAAEKLSKEQRWPKALVNAFSKGTVGTLPIAFRTQEELLKAFSKRNGWRVLRCEYAFAEDPLQTVYQNNLANECLSCNKQELSNIKREYAQATMHSWKAACLEGLVMSTTTKDGISLQIARDFWDSVCHDSVERMLREDGCCDDTRLGDRYNLGIPAHFILVERLD